MPQSAPVYTGDGGTCHHESSVVCPLKIADWGCCYCYYYCHCSCSYCWPLCQVSVNSAQKFLLWPPIWHWKKRNSCDSSTLTSRHLSLSPVQSRTEGLPQQTYFFGHSLSCPSWRQICLFSCSGCEHACPLIFPQTSSLWNNDGRTFQILLFSPHPLLPVWFNPRHFSLALCNSLLVGFPVSTFVP